jgi:hypothetical protein
MNPLLAAGLAELEQKGMALAIDAVTLLVQDLASGKDLVAALNDLAMAMAEKQAKLIDSALDAVKE